MQVEIEVRLAGQTFSIVGKCLWPLHTLPLISETEKSCAPIYRNVLFSHMTMECKKHLSSILYSMDCSCGLVKSTSYQESYIEAPLSQVEVYVYKGRRFPTSKNLWIVGLGLKRVCEFNHANALPVEQSRSIHKRTMHTS